MSKEKGQESMEENMILLTGNAAIEEMAEIIRWTARGITFGNISPEEGFNMIGGYAVQMWEKLAQNQSPSIAIDPELIDPALMADSPSRFTVLGPFQLGAYSTTDETEAAND